jgi:hypothetical protein
MLGIAVAVPQAAQAQSRGGLFGALFGGIFSAPPPVHRDAPLAYSDPSGDPSAAERPSGRVGRGGQAFCVRTCDGRYFPITSAAGNSPESTCNAMCPAAKTRIFWGSQNTPGVGSDGVSYTDTDNAYVFRDKIVDGCTCNGKTSFGLATLDVKDDPTLRRGDMVATSEGVKVFNGNTRVGHRATDFEIATNYTRLPTEVRRHLATMSVAPAAESTDRQ